MKSFERLVQTLTGLPGIGRKTAQRIAFFLLKQPSVSQNLADAIIEAQTRLHSCPVCFNLTENELCSICSDPGRDRSVVCVVEDPADVLILEQVSLHRGTYHCLGGVLSPIDNVGPEELHIRELLTRIPNEGIHEVILATNPTVEGEATAAYLARHLKSTGVRVTRIARGLPVGSDLGLADIETITRALEGRRDV